MATLVRWNTGRWAPVREAAVMQNELSRLMNGLFEGSPRQTQSWVPTLDAWETEGELVFAFDLPGVQQDKISVEAEDGTLTISAERERGSEISDERYHRLERRHGTFTRAVGLPQGVVEDAIKASYVDGVLEIRVPKPEQVKPKKIQIGFDSGPPRSKAPRRTDAAHRQPTGRGGFGRPVSIQAASPSRIRSATDAISSLAPVTSWSSSSALGPCPSDHSSRSRSPASRRANQSFPSSLRRKSRNWASNAHERR